MSTRRRVGVSLATSEAARRQLMQATPCWQKVWALPDNAPPGSTIKVYKWVKTNKVQVRNNLFSPLNHHLNLVNSNSVTTKET